MSKKINFVDHKGNPLANCHYEIVQNNRVLISGQADAQGKTEITQTISSITPVKILFWLPERQRDGAYETDHFLWAEEISEKWIKAPEEYVIPLRRTDNIAEEPANYMQKMHKVEQGDTLYNIANRYHTTVDAIKTKNNLESDTIAIGQQLLLPENATRPTPSSNGSGSTSNSTPSNLNPEQSSNQSDDPIADVIDEYMQNQGTEENFPDNNTETDQSSTPSEQPVETPPQSQPAPTQPNNPPSEPTSGTPVEQDRSAQTGRPESVATADRANECWCDRDFTVEEVRKIILLMRRMENISSQEIFSAWNSPLGRSDRTFERLTEELNKMFRNREINTCMRKIQFFAQCYHESDRFRTTLEYQDGYHLERGRHRDAIAMGHTQAGDGPRYKGRGIIQVTWRKTQYAYFEDVIARYPGYFGNKTVEELFNRVGIYSENMGNRRTFMSDSAALIARDLFLSCDASGWFWTQYKKYRRNNLNYYADMGIYGFGTVTSLVHGGSSTITTRLPYYRRLRDEVFQFSTRCVNRNQLNTNRSITFGSTAYWNTIRNGEL